jgi:hypothetical protein
MIARGFAIIIEGESAEYLSIFDSLTRNRGMG